MCLFPSFSNFANGKDDNGAGSGPGQVSNKRPSTAMSSDDPDDILAKSNGGIAFGNVGNVSVIGEQREDVKKFGFPISPMQTYSFSECRSLVKTVVCAVKTISWGIASCKVGNTCSTTSSESGTPGSNSYKQFSAKETEVYLRLIKWGLKAIDIYAINGPVITASGATALLGQRPINTQGVRSKEEKEVLEHFAGAVSLIY